MRIRPYSADKDAAGLRRCFVALQEHERSFFPRAPEGERIADAYLAAMWRSCNEHAGVVYVADDQGTVLGFITLLRRVAGEPDDPDGFHARVSEFAVLEEARGAGVGTALFAQAHEAARRAGAPCMRLAVRAGNRGALRLYERLGFETEVLELSRPLEPVTPRPA